MTLSSIRISWLFAIIGLLVLLVPAPNVSAGVAPKERYFRIEAAQFAFAPGIVRVNPGDTVTLEIVATDVVHGIYIDDYALSTDADPGQPAKLTFIADRPGAFRFRCSVACGDMHPFMIGRLQVGPNWLLIRAVLLAGLAIVFSVTIAPRASRTAENGYNS